MSFQCLHFVHLRRCLQLIRAVDHQPVARLSGYLSFLRKVSFLSLVGRGVVAAVVVGVRTVVLLQIFA